MIRILIADDHPVLRKGLREIISFTNDMELVGEAVDGNEAIAKYMELKPDVVLMDLAMPEKTGAEATRIIRSIDPLARILVLTNYLNKDSVSEVLKAGAFGYILKIADPRDLIVAIRSVAHGEMVIPQLVAQKLAAAYSDEDGDPGQLLSERERDVLKLIAKGLSNQEIANTLHLADRTVRIYVTHILEKLKLSNRTQAALYAIRKRLVVIDDE